MDSSTMPLWRAGCRAGFTPQKCGSSQPSIQPDRLERPIAMASAAPTAIQNLAMSA
jgi:hypothetical protein